MTPLGDRRTHVRFDVVGSLWGTLEIRTVARVINISPGGALIEGPVVEFPGGRHMLTLQVGGQPIRLEVRVRHVTSLPRLSHEPPEYRIGVEFVDEPPAAFIESFL